MHDGRHTCKAKNPKVNRAVLLKAVAQNPGVKPNKLINDPMVQLMSADNLDWNEIDNLARAFVDVKRVHNARAEIQNQLNPMGQNFEALGIFKQKCDERDKYLVYRINSRQLNGLPSYVLKSSKEMVQLALFMDRDGTGLLNHEYAHVDAMHDRCRAFKTLTLWTYHEAARKLVCLAIMDVEEENSENLTTFWTLLNEMLQDFTGRPDYQFNPAGFVADEHHANWRSINAVFGRSATERTVSCEFHFKQSVHRHARKMGHNSSEFIKVANDLLEASTENEFDKSCIEMEQIIAQSRNLFSWFNWWLDRKTHIFRAFKPTNAPSTNLAEVGHSKLASVGRRGMSVLEAARNDVATAIRQNTELNCFIEGLASGGRGLTAAQRHQKSHRAEKKRAAAYGNEIVKDILPAKKAQAFVQNEGIH
jgi:hypothetical protein